MCRKISFLMSLILLGALVTNASAAFDPSVGLLIYYDFDNRDPCTVLDMSGNGNHGDEKWCPPLVYEPSFGGFGEGVTLNDPCNENGCDDFVDINDVVVADFGNATVALWARLNAAIRGSWANILGHDKLSNRTMENRNDRGTQEH